MKLAGILFIALMGGLLLASKSPPAQVQIFDIGCTLGTPLNQLTTRNPVTGNQKAFGCLDSSGNILYQGKRFVTSGTPLVASNFVPSSGFGVSPSITSVVGTDAAFNFKITTGSSGTSLNPFIQLNFADGPYPNRITYVCFAFLDSNGNFIAVSNISNQTTISSQFLWLLTPAASTAYDIECAGVPQ